MRELTRGHGPWPEVQRSGDKEMFPVSASPGLRLVKYTKQIVDLSYFVAAQVVHSFSCRFQLTSQLIPLKVWVLKMKSQDGNPETGIN